MNLQTAFVLVCIFGSSISIPVQIGILASNSNELLRLNGLTLTGVGFGQAQVQPQYVLQQPALGFPPQMVNLNPQVAGPFGPQGPQLLIPTQGNQQLTSMLFPNAQQDQPMAPQDPNNPGVPQQPQNTPQMVPQFYYPYTFPQHPRMQGVPLGYPYYLPPYANPQQTNPTMVVQPNNPQAGQVQQNLGKPTQKPQLPLQQAVQPRGQGDKTWLMDVQTESSTPPPDHRGDTAGPVFDEGHANFPFLFEP